MGPPRNTGCDPDGYSFQANMRQHTLFVLITSANRECSRKPAHASNLARAFTACIRTLVKSVYQKN